MPVDGEPRDYVATARGLATSPRFGLEGADNGGVALTSLWQVAAALFLEGANYGGVALTSIWQVAASCGFRGCG